MTQQHSLADEPTSGRSARALALVGQQSWVVVGEPPVLHRLTLDGEPVGDGLSLPRVGERPRLLAVDDQSALWIGDEAVTVHLARGVWQAEPCGAAFAGLVALLDGQWLGLRDHRLWLHEPTRTTALDCAFDLARVHVVAGAQLGPDRAALLLDGEDGQTLVVLDLPGGTMRQRVALGGVAAARFATRRGHAVLLEGASHLVVVDLRFGIVLARHQHLRPIVDFAVDARGEHILIQHRTTAEDELLCLPYARLFDRDSPSLHAIEPDIAAPPSAEPLLAREPAPSPPAAHHETPPRSSRWAATERHRPSPGLRRPRPQPPRLRNEAPARPTAPAAALLPRAPTVSPDEAAAALQTRLAWVGALCKRALADGWDSGRLAFADADGRPFESEVAALLDGARGRADAVRAEACSHATHLEAEMRAREGTAAATPMERLARDHTLSPLAVDALWIVAAPALRGELARAYAIVANDAARPLCDELLVAQILDLEPSRRRALSRAIEELSRRGLVVLGAGEPPFARLSLRPVLVGLLSGDAPEHCGDADEVAHRRADRGLDELTLDRELVAAVRAALAEVPADARLVLRGRAGSGRTALLAALAATAGRDLGLIEATTIAPEELRDALFSVSLRGWVPCLSGLEHAVVDDLLRRERLREVLHAHPGPLLFRCTPGMLPPLASGYSCFDLPSPSEAERSRLWRDALVSIGLNGECADDLAARHRVGPGVIRAVASALPVGTDADTASLVESALRHHRHTRIGEVATRVTRLSSWGGVVLPNDVVDSIRELIGRIRHRRMVFETWGFDQLLTSARGLTALFSGGPGTGKSMAAGLIARELGYELYRVDLSRVLSKWVGETEKNLATVFDAAEDGEMVLLFDEADSLFARRTTDVKNANDRYANIEVNYLLQRLDSFEGIAILTTNAASAIDPAFKRRLSFRLTFPFPDEVMRADLWRAHLPPDLPVAGELDFEQLANRYELSGGYIRNAAVRAAFLAAEENRHLTQEHLERAVQLEYRELGKIVDSGKLE